MRRRRRAAAGGRLGGGAGPAARGAGRPVVHLFCAGGILVGGSGRSGLFLLDPRIDADARHLDVDLGGPLDHLAATHSVVWAFATRRSEATLVAVRSGRHLDE